jgi:hypothetical protein
MAQDVVRLLFCDRHSEQGETLAGVAAEDQDRISGLLNAGAKTTILSLPIGFDGVWKSLDWCPACLAEIIEPLRKLWDEAGVEIDAPRGKSRHPSLPKGDARRGRQSDKPQDRQCLWCVESYASDTGLSGHLVRDHNLPKTLGEVFGNKCPLCGKEFPSLGRHTMRDHGVSHITQAFVRARGDGDKFKVVATIVAQAS